MEASQQQQQPSDHATVAALTLILLSGLPLAAMTPYAVALLGGLGISAAVVQTILGLIEPRVHPPAQRVLGAAQGWANRTSAAHTASYVLAASRRLMAGGSVDAERRYLTQHIAARQARMDSARQVDAAAQVSGPTLGWYAVMDERTTPACRTANGRNFVSAYPPVIGYPGTLHGGTCRCKAGPPFRDGGSVDEAFLSGTGERIAA